VTAVGWNDDALRALTPQVLGALVRRYGNFDACEDATQEALLAASRQWPRYGYPSSPKAWLISVASRRLIDELRSDSARRRRERSGTPPLDALDRLDGTDHDDTLTLLFLCCHPALVPASQLALTLRAVGGLTTAEIARALLLPKATVAQRITRAKHRIKEAGARFELPPVHERAERLRVVQHVLYLVFNEGYASTSGPDLVRDELTRESIRLTRGLHRALPSDGEVAGLLALMLLTEARRPARMAGDGALIDLAEQDRRLWDRSAIAEGVELITRSLATGPLGPYQLQAAIAALHDEALRAEDTDWPQILALYDLLERLAPNPIVTLNRAVAVAMVHGVATALAVLAPLDGDDRVANSHRLVSVRAHLLEMGGDHEGAYDAYRAAARQTTSAPERRYLEARAARCGEVRMEPLDTVLRPSGVFGPSVEVRADADEQSGLIASSARQP
jgi:RNA polymerase sigma factor (sigma-70 family)